MDTNVNALAIWFIQSKFFDVNNILSSVTASNFARNFVLTSNNHNFVVSSDWDRSNTIFLSKLLGKRSTHDNAALGRWCWKKSFSALSSGRTYSCKTRSVLNASKTSKKKRKNTYWNFASWYRKTSKEKKAKPNFRQTFYSKIFITTFIFSLRAFLIMLFIIIIGVWFLFV